MSSPFDPTFLLGSAGSGIICCLVFGSRFGYKDQEFLTLPSCINQNFRLLSSRWGQEKQNPDTEFTTENLVMTTLELFFAGTETVSTTLKCGILLLMKYPEIKEKVHKEIDQVIGRSRLPATEDRSHMPYTDAVIHEVHRFADVIPMSLPHITTQDVQFRAYVIPKGTTVIPLLSSVLWDTSQFKNLDVFDPGHFLDGSGHFQKSNAFMPFSAGKRMCVGESLARLEVFLFLPAILQGYTLEPLGDPGTLGTSPVESGLGNIPHPYELRLLPR
ncbi:unnamed protein product [Lepidochelys olivacea]